MLLSVQIPNFDDSDLKQLLCGYHYFPIKERIYNCKDKQHESYLTLYQAGETDQVNTFVKVICMEML